MKQPAFARVQHPVSAVIPPVGVPDCEGISLLPVLIHGYVPPSGKQPDISFADLSPSPVQLVLIPAPARSPRQDP